MSGRGRFLGLPGGMALVVAGVMALTAPVATGTDPPCRVRNVTQDTVGRSIVRVVERAVDGDRLRLRGTCWATGQPWVNIQRDLTITGVGHRPTLTGREKHPILWIWRGSKVTLRHLTIERGFGAAVLNEGSLRLLDSVVQDSQGKGIVNARRLVVVDSVIRRNRAVDEDPRELVRGGGISASHRTSRIILRRSVVRGNSATGHGGGIYSRAPVRIVDSIVRGNRADEGGGIYVGTRGSLTLVGSVVRRNRADARGGGIFNAQDGVLTLVGTSVSSNEAGTEGGGIWNDSALGASITLDDASSVVENSPDDCVGTPAC